MSAVQLLKKASRIFMKSSKAKKEEHVTEGYPQRINNPPSSNQQEEKCDDGEEDDDKVEECNAEDLKKETKLFVGSLAPSVTSKELEVYFSRFGQVIDSVVLRHPKSGQSRGFGFVTFANPESVKVVLETKDHILDGKAINPQPFKSKSKEKNYEKCVFLGNLPFDCTEEELKQFFGKFGEVEDVAIPLERKTMKSKGFGFLTLKDKLVAEKLLAQGFVNLKNRRIPIKKADPPDFNKINVDLNVGSISDVNVYEGAEICESFADEKFRHRRLSDDDDISSVVSGKKQSIELKNKMDFEIQKLVENYFLSKFSNEKETKNESNKVCDVGEVEKLLADFFINSSEQFGTSEENLIEFSDESESRSSDTEEDTIDEEKDDTDDDISDSDADNFESSFQELSALIPNILNNKSGSYTEISEFNSSAPQTSEFFAPQKSPMPFKIKDQKGRLVCSLCQWVSPESSCETFLVHCKTVAHRMKLKERFLSEKKQEEIPKAEFLQSSKRSQKKSSKSQAFPKKQFSEKQNENRRNQKSQEKEQKQLQLQQQQFQAINELMKKQTSKRVIKKEGDKRETQRSSELKAKKVKTFSIFALAKSMACIQPLSENKIICKMCDKVIPKALDTSTLMKNISHHLQSKGHLNNVLEVERSLRKVGKKTDKKKMSCNTKKENSNEKNARKVEISKQNLPTNVPSLLKEQKIFKEKNVTKFKNLTPETVRKHSSKKEEVRQKDILLKHYVSQN